MERAENINSRKFIKLKVYKVESSGKGYNKNSRKFIKFIKLKVVEKIKIICDIDSADEKLSVSEKINNFTNFMNFKLKKEWALALKYSE